MEEVPSKPIILIVDDHPVFRQGVRDILDTEDGLEVIGEAATAGKGKEYHECYDVLKALPSQEHYDMYRKVKDEIAEMGVEFPF